MDAPPTKIVGSFQRSTGCTSTVGPELFSDLLHEECIHTFSPIAMEYEECILVEMKAWRGKHTLISYKLHHNNIPYTKPMFVS
jgi:hypothetical protein